MDCISPSIQILFSFFKNNNEYSQKRVADMKKIVFMGTPEFSVPILVALAKEYNVAAVVTQPDRRIGRKRILTPTPVKQVAEKLGIPVLQPEKITGSKEMAYIIEEVRPDLIITAAFGQFLPEKLLKTPTYGAINVHASLLPKYRGGAPIHYAVMNGDEKTGVTIMYMEKKMDAGDILRQQAIPITEEDDTGTMFDKLSLVGRDLLMQVLPDLFDGNIQAVPQNEAEVTYSPNISREQEEIDWNASAQTIEWKIRGLRPFPGAFTTWQKSRLKIWDARAEKNHTDKQAGIVLNRTEMSIQVSCGNGTVLSLLEVQPAGKGRMAVKDFLIGAGQFMKEGDHIGQ